MQGDRHIAGGSAGPAEALSPPGDSCFSGTDRPGGDGRRDRFLPCGTFRGYNPS